MKRLGFAVALFFGCTSPNPNTGSAVDPKFGASLTVLDSSQESIGPFGVASPGQIFILADVVLANQGSTVLPLDSSLFSVEISAGLAYPADSNTQCSGGAGLVGGHSIGCPLLFEVPLPGQTAAILYRLPDASTLRAPVTTAACSQCNGQCTDLRTDPNNCGACGVRAQGCTNGVPVCTVGYAFCQTGCVLVTSDANNCGDCGHACGAGSLCKNSVCVAGPSGSACSAMANSECVDCCRAANPAGSAFYTQQFQVCLCTSPGDCATDCAADFCPTGTVTDPFCQLCVQSSTCDITSQCQANSACTAFVACANDCPAS